jgi:hypothetical protein
MPGASGARALLGRGRERAELYDALSLALKGEHQVAVVAGDAGVGKTTLVADLAERSILSGSPSRRATDKSESIIPALGGFIGWTDGGGICVAAVCCSDQSGLVGGHDHLRTVS